MKMILSFILLLALSACATMRTPLPLTPEQKAARVADLKVEDYALQKRVVFDAVLASLRVLGYQLKAQTYKDGQVTAEKTVDVPVASEKAQAETPKTFIKQTTTLAFQIERLAAKQTRVHLRVNDDKSPLNDLNVYEQIHQDLVHEVNLRRNQTS